jgi:hypothetical protein
LEVAEAVVEFVAVSVVQMETVENRSVFFFVFVAVQRGFAVAEISVPVAEEPSVVVSYFMAHVFLQSLKERPHRFRHITLSRY